ncbi:uncharacterized protein LOC131941379 [Physella acuta]|uniref:uncharacterized protein LOC131941379 n=1 Tax=Physella acuta TaxID=109671 RepID=UPI0027DB2EB4|nr:uncharacterized protein LOC131941379 [Physella acuta]
MASIITYLSVLMIASLDPGLAQLFGDSQVPLNVAPPPMIMDDIDPVCYNFTIGNWRVQEFFSPNYPGEYLNNTDCVLYLEAPPGFIIQLDFREKFQVEKSDKCKYDHLEVRDGPFAYSPLINRYCDASFPPMITSSGRHLWLRFKTDGILQYGGFKAVYTYHKENAQNDGTAMTKGLHTPCRKVAMLTVNEADGVISSSDITLDDVSHSSSAKEVAMDCTWEIYTNKGYLINLRSLEFQLGKQNTCEQNKVTVYDRTTVHERDQFCHGGTHQIDLTSTSNRIFVHIFGVKFKARPNIRIVYSLVRKGDCTTLEMKCGDLCLPAVLRCNDVINCKDKSDERGCKRRVNDPYSGKDGNHVTHETDDRDSSSDNTESSGFSSLHAIILGAVGGFLLTCVIVTTCVMCHIRKRDREKRQELHRQKSPQRNALEMAVCNSSSTSMSLSKKNENSGNRSGPGGDRHHYVTFSKMNSPPSNNMMDGGHRYSVPDHTGPEGDRIPGDRIPDQMTESGNYKRYLTMEITPDDMMDESIQHGIYPPSPGVMGMTNLDHRMPDIYGNYHSNQWHCKEDPSMYPYGSSSLTRPTPFLGLSKPFTCSQPDPRYETKYIKTIKTLDNDTIKEHQLA